MGDLSGYSVSRRVDGCRLSYIVGVCIHGVILAVLQPVPACDDSWIDHLELFHVRVEVDKRKVSVLHATRAG